MSDLSGYTQTAADVARTNAAADRFTQNKALLFTILREHGAAVAEVDFDGSSDEGMVDQPFVHDEGSENLTEKFETILVHGWADSNPEPRENLLSVLGAIECLAWSILEGKHGGWEINDGAFGSIRFHVESCSIELTINHRYITHNTCTEAY